MQHRRLGRSDLTIAPIVFGGNVFGWTVDEAMTFRLLDAFVDAGFNAIDTADMYSTWVPGHVGGESETLIGRWLAKSGKRDAVVLMTKVGMEVGGSKGLAPDRIRAAVEGSLRRLQTDRIDLYQAHRDDPATPLEATLGAFDALVREGHVRAIGASNYDGARLREALATSERLGLASYVSLQPEYNLLERDAYERDLAPVVEDGGLAVVPYSSLASGFLTGKYRARADLAKSPRGGSLGRYLDGAGPAVLRALDAVAGRHDATPAQIALAWLLAQPTVTAPIVSATSPEQLDGTLRAVAIDLGADDRAELDRASAPTPASASAT